MRAKLPSKSPTEAFGHSKNCGGFSAKFLNENRGSHSTQLLQQMEHNCKTQIVNYFILNRPQTQNEKNWSAFYEKKLTRKDWVKKGHSQKAGGEIRNLGSNTENRSDENTTTVSKRTIIRKK